MRLTIPPAPALLLPAALLMLAGCQTTSQPAAELSRKVHEARIASPAPALAAVTVTCDGRVLTAQDGSPRMDSTIQLAAGARFNIGSNAKSMLATLAATFVEDGTLSWETTVEEVFAAEAETLDPVLRKATLMQILSHRSGVPAYSSGQELSGFQASGQTASEQRLSFALHALRSAPASPPGSAFLYSNAGYVIAGVMLERVGGKPFEDLMHERVFTPLGMRGAQFGEPGADETGQPIGHYTREGAQTVYLEDEPAIPPFLQPAGNVALPMADYGKYLKEHLCGLQGKQTRLLPAATIAQLHAPQGEDGASMGWGRYAFEGAPASIHTGGTGTFMAFVAIIPSRDLAVATATNSADGEARQAALSLMQALIAEHLSVSRVAPGASED